MVDNIQQCPRCNNKHHGVPAMCDECNYIFTINDIKKQNRTDESNIKSNNTHRT